MTDLTLPVFKYHPDPVATGSITASDGKCQACNEHRGFIYTGAVYSERDLADALFREPGRELNQRSGARLIPPASTFFFPFSGELPVGGN